MQLDKLTIELTNLCNLDCAYCFKEAGRAHLNIDLLTSILQQARKLGASKITYTGGEIALYPNLAAALENAAALGYRYAIVTNGWHFQQILPLISATRHALKHIFFSIDAANEADHDRARGKGSFRKIMNAVSLCRFHNLPFSFQLVVNNENFAEMERVALLAARLGAASVKFGHMLPTSASIDQQLSLSADKRQAAENEARALAAIFKISIAFSASESNRELSPPCEALSTQAVSIDARGRLSLCCQLSGYRGGDSDSDIIADLNEIDFASAYEKFLTRAEAQQQRRIEALRDGLPEAQYPCHFCIATMAKTPWRHTLYALGMRGES